MIDKTVFIFSYETRDFNNLWGLKTLESKTKVVRTFLENDETVVDWLAAPLLAVGFLNKIVGLTCIFFNIEDTTMEISCGSTKEIISDLLADSVARGLLFLGDIPEGLELAAFCTPGEVTGSLKYLDEKRSFHFKKEGDRLIASISKREELK